MAIIRSSSSLSSLTLGAAEKSESQRLRDFIAPGAGDSTIPNNVIPLESQGVYTALFVLKSGTDAEGLKQLCPDSVDLVFSFGQRIRVKQTVYATNRSSDTASIALFLARDAQNVVVDECQTIGDLPLERTVKCSAQAKAIMKAVVANPHMTGSTVETSEDCTFVTLAKVPAGACVSFTTWTTLPDLEFTQLIEERDDWAKKIVFTDVACLLPIVPIGTHVPTTVRSELGDGLTLVLPDKDAATHEARTSFEKAAVVLWAEAANMTFEAGLSIPVVLKFRVTKECSGSVDVAQEMENMSIGTSVHGACPTAVCMSTMHAGFSPETGKPRTVSLLHVDIPITYVASPKTNDVHVILAIDESGSTYVTMPGKTESNLVMAKQSAVRILTAFVRDHVPILRRNGALAAGQRIFVSVVMFHHGCRTIVDRLNVSDPATDLSRTRDAILADGASGGTNFCAFATSIEAITRDSPDVLVVVCVLTDGGAHDLSLFTKQMHSIREHVVDLRMVVVGFGAWVDEATARRINTDGYAMVPNITDTNVVCLAMQLLPKAVIAATCQASLTFSGATVLSLIRTDEGTKALPVTTSYDADDLNTSVLLEPGSSIRALYMEEQGDVLRLSCNGMSIEGFRAHDEEQSFSLEVLGMLDPLYFKAGLVELPSGKDFVPGVITAIGLEHKLSTSYTMPVSTICLPGTLVAPAAHNWPVVGSLTKIIAPAVIFHSFSVDVDDSAIVYRSLGGIQATSPSVDAMRDGPPDIQQWMRSMANHADLIDHTNIRAVFGTAMASLQTPLSSGKRSREALMAGIDEASFQHLPSADVCVNLYPLPESALSTAQGCVLMMCLIGGKVAPLLAELDTREKIQSFVERVDV